MDIIDPHLHFFALEQGRYAWLLPSNPPFWPDKAKIAKTFTESSLVTASPITLAGYVHIEAGFDNDKPWREVDWLEANCHLPMRSVAGCNLLAAEIEAVVHALIKRPSVTGVRHILDDNAAAVLNSTAALRSLAMLEEAGLSFDAQLSLNDNAGVHALLKHCQQFPQLAVIINHAGFPLLKRADYTNWQKNLEKLAACANVAIKLSGWEMQDRQWCTETAWSVICDVLDVFGKERVMMASNFPLCLWRFSYAEYWQSCLSLLNEHLDEDVLASLFSENARCWYRLDNVTGAVPSRRG